MMACKDLYVVIEEIRAVLLRSILSQLLVTDICEEFSDFQP